MRAALAADAGVTAIGQALSSCQRTRGDLDTCVHLFISCVVAGNKWGVFEGRGGRSEEREGGGASWCWIRRHHAIVVGGNLEGIGSVSLGLVATAAYPRFTTRQLRQP